MPARLTADTCYYIYGRRSHANRFLALMLSFHGYQDLAKAIFRLVGTIVGQTKSRQGPMAWKTPSPSLWAGQAPSHHASSLDSRRERKT